ncbi:hypothetical protein M433DRAFT_70868, partial [Acidomyces richmondensis BFW]
DTDSAYGDEVSTYSASVRSSIYNSLEQYGRTYHGYKAGRYALPTDEVELDRLDIHHHLILRAMHNKLYFAPLPADFAGRVLDIGTGTGIWPIDFANEHQAAYVIGNDLAPTQPQLVPPNVQFYIEDVETAWTYPDHEAFDFIHARFLAGAIADWPQLLRNCYDHAKPGGHIEFQDWNTWLYSQDGTLRSECALNKFHQLTCGGRHAQGYNMKPGPELQQYFKDAGFINVQVQKILLPLGPWPKDKHYKEIGIINLIQMEQAVEGICLGVLTQLGPEAGGPWTWEQIQVFLAEIRNDMRNKKIHGVYDFYVVNGQKPRI